MMIQARDDGGLDRCGLGRGREGAQNWEMF